MPRGTRHAAGARHRHTRNRCAVSHGGEARVPSQRGFMRLTIIVLLTALLATSPGASAQTRFTFVPSVSIAGVYDNNLFVEGDERDSDAGKMLQIRPSVEGNYESPRLT